MMKKSNKGLAAGVILAMMVMAAGCVPSTDRTAVQRDPDFSQQVNEALDFTQLHNDAIDAFGDIDTNPYAYITDLEIGGDNNTKIITITATALDDVTQEEAEQFAAAAIRHVADAAVTQSNEFELSSQESFGTLWEKFALKLTISPENGGDAIYSLDIPAGGEIPLNADIETYEEAWVEQRDELLQNLVYDVNGNVVSE